MSGLTLCRHRRLGGRAHGAGQRESGGEDQGFTDKHRVPKNWPMGVREGGVSIHPSVKGSRGATRLRGLPCMGETFAVLAADNDVEAARHPIPAVSALRMAVRRYRMAAELGTGDLTRRRAHRTLDGLFLRLCDMLRRLRSRRGNRRGDGGGEGQSERGGDDTSDAHETRTVLISRWFRRGGIQGARNPSKIIWSA